MVEEEETQYSLTDLQLERLNERLALYSTLTADFPISLGLHTSKVEKNTTDLSMTYGELVVSTQEFMSFAEVLELSKERFGLQPGGIFADLGSVTCTQGTGKAVLAAALLHPFQRCIGVELLPGLHAHAESLRDTYMKSSGNVPLDFVCASFFDYDWTAASFIFVNATCFNKAMRERLASRIRSPALVFSVTYTMPGLQVAARLERQMSWGCATLFLHVV